MAYGIKLKSKEILEILLDKALANKNNLVDIKFDEIAEQINEDISFVTLCFCYMEDMGYIKTVRIDDDTRRFKLDGKGIDLIEL